MKHRRWFLFSLFLLLLGQARAPAVRAAAGEVFLPLLGTRQPLLAAIHGPLLVDSAAGRLYTVAEVDGSERAVSLDAETGELRRVLGAPGRLGLDRSRQRLLVDRAEEGVLVVDIPSGRVAGTLPLAGRAAAPPQVDPETGRAYIFRDHTIHVVDPDGPSLLRSVPLSLTISVCGDEQGPAPITNAFYDPTAASLFVSATTAVCTPWAHDTVVSLDGNLDHLGAFDFGSRLQAVAFAGNLYGSSVLSGHESWLSYWALAPTQKWHHETIPGSSAGLKGVVVDPARLLLYEAIWHYPDAGAAEKGVRVSTVAGRTLLYTVPWAQLEVGDAQLAGYDPATETLYFLEAGALHLRPVSVLAPAD